MKNEIIKEFHKYLKDLENDKEANKLVYNYTLETELLGFALRIKNLLDLEGLKNSIGFNTAMARELNWIQ